VYSYAGPARGVGVIEDIRHCIDNPGDGPVIADGLEVQFPGSTPTARLIVTADRTADDRPLPADPRACVDPAVGDTARFLSKHLEGEWHPPDRSRPDGDVQGDDTDQIVWELT